MAQAIVELLTQRDPAASICPSEAARCLWPAPAWRDHMVEVRRVALDLAARHFILVTRGTTVVADAAGLRGPVRLRRGPRFPG
ncbi:DUF3253 domain-containing protein [Luteimonas deserti]|uniref:DUF3253 domain-containing protein n=1 Tax=Luteimonas deserti TaxID=2752306 RepID=UPI002E2A4CCE|nr:DUF3253 domain-containing protein [Luteimonas deserti]